MEEEKPSYTMYSNHYSIPWYHEVVLGKITPLFPFMLTQAAVAEREDLGTPTESQPTPSPTQPSTCGNGRDQVNLPYDIPLLGGHTSDRAEGSLNLEALSALCTNLSDRVLALVTVKDARAKEILTLKARIKKLKKRCKPSISHHRSWLRSMSLLSKKKKFSKRNSVSKQGRKNAKSGPTKDDSDKLNAELDEYIEYIDTEEVLNEGRLSTVDTKWLDDDTARSDMTLADTLIKLKDDKDKGVAFKYSESTDRLARSILTLKPLPTIDPKDKGKGEVDCDERAKLLAEYFKRRKKQLAEERAAAIRNKPPTKTQLRRLMMTYLKNIGRFTHSQLNKKSFKDIQGLYMKEQELILDFVPIGSEEDERMIRDMNKKGEEESSDKGVDITKKRKEGSRMKRMSKRQKDDVDLEEEKKLKTFLKIDPDEEGVIDYEGDLRTMFEANTEDELWQNQEKWSLKSLNFYENYRVHILILEDGTEIHMLTERSKELASPKQTALGKDNSNPLIVDSLLKTLWLSMHHVIAMKHWLFQSKRLQLAIILNRLSKIYSKGLTDDDTPMCERHEANYIQSEGYQNQNSHHSYSHQSHHDPNDPKKSLTLLNNDVRNDLEHFKRCIRSMRTVNDKLFDRDDQSKTNLEKSITKFLDGQRVASMYIKNNVNDMIIKMKQNEKNYQTTFKNLERNIDEWSKSQNVSSEQTDMTDPPPPQAHIFLELRFECNLILIFCSKVEMSRDVLTVESTMRIPLLYRGEYSQWVERFMNYLEEQTDGEAMINSIKNGDQPLPRVTQVSIAGTTSTEQPPLKDKSMWSD
uniref:Uncharacterized protein n=1 Tax=Tanacetum cinerariifolium TaxID=118510 RepID=A0A699GRT7_TANCI|nr:hypothetical protein [Tanacetum cinerariifolium]